MQFRQYILSSMIVLVFLSPLSASEPQTPFNNSYTDVSIILGSLLVGAVMYEVQINENNPLLRSEVKPYRSETIPTWSLVAVHLGYAVTPFFIDPSDDLRHFRGFVFAFSMNFAAWSSVSSLVGRKRPNYDDALLNNQKAERRSFYSGHTSESFSSATYMSLYLKDHIESNSLKTGLPILMYSYAFYVSNTRRNENFHHLSDIVAGAAVGTVITYYSYKLFQNGNRNLELSGNQSSLNLSYKF